MADRIRAYGYVVILLAVGMLAGAQFARFSQAPNLEAVD